MRVYNRRDLGRAGEGGCMDGLGTLKQKGAGMVWTDFPMPLMCTPFEPGHIDEAVASIADPDRQAIARAEMYYFTARPEEACKAAEPYLESRDFGLRLSALLIYGYASLTLNRSIAAKKCMEATHAIGGDPLLQTCPQAGASYMLIAMAGHVLLHLPAPFDEISLYRSMRLLPEGLRMFASYVAAHKAYLGGEYGRCVGCAENALAMRQERYPISELYLSMVTTMGWINLKDSDRAEKWFAHGWDLARPDGLIEGIAEHHGLLQGVLEKCMREDYPDDLARILKVTYAFSYGWRRLHNPETGDDVADDLTTTEFSIAMLACRDWSNDQIAAHMGVSKGTVKNRLSSVYAKLGITSRSELAQYMLK